MKINYFFRKYNSHQISIEKLFDIIIKSIEEKGIKTYKIVNPYNFSVVGMFRSMLYFRKNQAQINHITGDIHWASLFLDANRTILTIHDLVGLEQMKGIKRKLYFLLWVYLPIRKLKYITAISEKTKQEIVNLIPWSKDKITVIPNCVSIEINKKDEVKEISDIPNILIVGTRQNKNIDRVFRALKGLNIHLTIVGNLSTMQEKYLMENKFKYDNLVGITESELLKCYQKAHVLCFMSVYEGFGLPILEAQAQNCCVITSDLSPMNEVAGEGALLVNPYSVESIRSAIKDLINNKEERQRLTLLGKKNVVKYSVENVANLYIKLYVKILNKT